MDRQCGAFLQKAAETPQISRMTSRATLHKDRLTVLHDIARGTYLYRRTER
jgi:hypothetical protein